METRIYLVRYRTADNRVQTDFWEFPNTHRFYDYESFLTVFYSLLELQNGYVLSVQFDTV